MVMMEEMDLGFKIPATSTFKIVEKVLIVTLMVMGEVYIGLRLAPITTITQVSLLDCRVFMFMEIRGSEIGLRPSTFLHMIMV